MADKDILQEALDAFQAAEAAETDNRTKALDDLRFARLEGYQWPDKVRRQREADGRPCLEINRMPTIIRQVVNDARQNRPGISVHPVEKGDVKTADVFSGLIRNIESQSNADVAYDTGVDSSVTMGFGYWRVNIDYACDDSFDKDIVIRAVPNPFAVYGDPYSQCADSSDWMSAFVIDQMSEAQFKRKYPKAKNDDFASGSWASGWCDQTAKTARVAEFWKRTEIERELIQYTIDEDPEIQIGFIDDLEKVKATGRQITPIQGATRKVKSYRVKQYTVTAKEVLNELDWAGRYIPIIPVYGEEVNVEGKRHFRSLIRDAKGPQQMLNFFRTASAELAAYAPRAPFIGKKGAFASDPRWATANNASHPYLEYDGQDAPQRQPFNGMSPADLQQAMSASDDIKAVTGIYDASLGARSNETSGKAILARQREGDVSTFHFIDNLARSIRHTGKILIDLIPQVYTPDRVVRVLGEDKKAKQVTITDKQSDPVADIYNLSEGKYDLTIRAGASYTTQREEALEMLTSLVQAQPEAAAILGDIIVELMDIPGGDRAVKRLQAMLPPQIKAAEEGDNPEAQAAQQQVQQITEQAQQIIGDLRAELEKAQNDKQADQQKASTEQYKAVTDRLTAMQNMITPDMIQALVIETMQDAMQTSALLPDGDMPQEMPQPMPGPAPMPQMQPAPEMGMGQAEGAF